MSADDDEIDIEQRQQELEDASSYWDSRFADDSDSKSSSRREPITNAVQSAVEDTDVDSDGVPILSARKLTQKRQRAFASSSPNPWMDSDLSDSDFRGSSSASSGMDSKHGSTGFKRPRTKPKSKPRPKKKQKKDQLSPVSTARAARQFVEQQYDYRQMSLDEVKENYMRGHAALNSNSPEEADSLLEELKRNGLAGGAGEDPVAGMVNVSPKDVGGVQDFKPEDPDLLVEPDWKPIEDAEPEKNPDPRWCALCLVTQRVIDIGKDNDFYKELVTYTEDNWGKQTVTAMATELQHRWNTTLRPYVDPEDLRLPCHKQMMWKHFAYHAPTRRIEMEITQARYRLLCRRMYETEERDRALSTNPKACGMYLKLEATKAKHQVELDKLRPHRVM